MRKLILTLCILITLSGCASVVTKVTNPQGQVYIVESKKDALVTYQKDGVNLTVDNRGKMGIFENLMGILLMKTDVNLKNKEGSD